MRADLRFHLPRLLISSCIFSRSGGTETELADLRPPTGLQLGGMRKAISPIELVAPGEFPVERDHWPATVRDTFPRAVPDNLTSVKTG